MLAPLAAFLLVMLIACTVIDLLFCGADDTVGGEAALVGTALRLPGLPGPIGLAQRNWEVQEDVRENRPRRPRSPRPGKVGQGHRRLRRSSSARML